MRLFQKISMKKTIAVALSSSSSITTHLSATEGLKFTVNIFLISYNLNAHIPVMAFINVWMQVVFPAPLGPSVINPCLTFWVSKSWITFSFQGG